jgi:hypothetical protein
MNKFQPGTVPVRVIYNPGDLTKAAFTAVDPNPVVAELNPLGRRPSRSAPSPRRKPKAAARLPPAPPSPIQTPRPLAESSGTERRLWVRRNLPTLYARGAGADASPTCGKAEVDE